MSWTLVVATYGALSGTAGTIVAVANRRDAVWGRRARSRDLRQNLEPMRDVLTEARIAPDRTASLTGNLQFRAHVQEIGEGIQRCPDHRMRKHLKEINTRCLTVINSASTIVQPQSSYVLTVAIEQALSEITAALGRLERIDRRAPS